MQIYSSSNNEHSTTGQPDNHDGMAVRILDLEAQLAASQQDEVVAQARIAELEAQLAVQSTVRDTSATRRFDALLEVCSALLIVHNIDVLLKLLIEKIPTLFPGTNNALLFLADVDTQDLVLRATSNGAMLEFAVTPGHGVAGRAFLAPRAMLMVGPELEESLKSLETYQRDCMQTLLQDWPPTSALLAPLRFEDERIGALILYSGTHAKLYHPRDLPFIQTLADLVAVAISEAQQRAHARALERDLVQVQSMHAETQARLGTAQAQLLQSAKLAAVGELAASVAHEINNPLYAARNSLYLVEQDLPADAPQRPFLEIAQNELGRIARIITRMRDFYRPTRAELAPTDVNKLLLETVELVQTHLRHNRITVTRAIDAHIPLLMAHADQLRQVFLNLMLNACDAMPDGGNLCVQTQRQTPAGEHAQAIVIDIVDTGSGIAEEHLPYLFEPFYTTKPQGTGLGLAISAHIITQHDGQIAVESVAGQGTTFKVTLPVT